MSRRRETFTLYRSELGMGRGALCADYDLWSIPQWELGGMPASPRVLDVGANVGLFSVLVGERWGGARVMAFEPHPETFRLLVENVRGRGVECRNVAVTGDGQERQLYEGSTSGECSTRANLVDPRGRVRQDMGKWHRIKSVRADALPPCDVLKVDTEGCEVEIVRGYMHLRGVHVLLVECHPVAADLEGEVRAVTSFAEWAGLALLDRRGDTLRFLRRGE